MANEDLERTAVADESTRVLPVVQEEMHIDKRLVDTGRGVRVHKTVSTHTEAVEHDLLREAVAVRHVVVDQIVSLSDAPQVRQEGDTLIVPIVEEILVVEKRLRIKEEVHITRTATSQRHTESVVLRSEQVAVERFDDSPDHDSHSTIRR